MSQSIEHFYLIGHGDPHQPEVIYMGKCTEDVDIYFKKHLRDALNGDEKVAHEEMRHIGLNKCFIQEVGNSDEGFVEADFVAAGKSLGYKLLNRNGGNRKVATARDTKLEAETRRLLRGADEHRLPTEEEKATFRAVIQRRKDEWQAAHA